MLQYEIASLNTLSGHLRTMTGIAASDTTTAEHTDSTDRLRGVGERAIDDTPLMDHP